jgi:hypothetical protein
LTCGTAPKTRPEPYQSSELEAAQSQRPFQTIPADGRSVYVYHDDKTSAPLYQLELATGTRELITTLAPSDVAGVTTIVNVHMTADGKTYAYSFSRELSDLFLVDGAR